MSNRALWEQMYRRFDPELGSMPAEWRAERPHSPIRDIERALDRPVARTQPHVLLAGTMGTGKTTELLRVAEGRARKGEEFVVFLDLVRHFQNVVGDVEALQHLTSWEVCFLIGVALVRSAEERLGYAFKAELIKGLEDAWAAAAKAADVSPTTAQIDVASLAKSMLVLATDVVPGAAAVGASLKLLGAAAGATRWTLPIGRRQAKPLDDQDTTMQTLLARINGLISTFQQWNRRVLFVVDGLDRIRDFERAQALFLQSEMIGRLVCPLVVAAPFALRYHKATSTIRGFSKICTLVNEPVLALQDPLAPGEGVLFLCEVYRKRVADLDAKDAVSEALLARMAYYSGGSPRDFVKMMGTLAEHAWDVDAVVATDALGKQVLDESRRLLETGVDQGDIDVLEKVAHDPKHRLPNDDRAQELLNYGRLLSYPNESEWFYPHPLLTLHLVDTGPTGSNA